ncbi:hypothetical protein J2Z21_005720 [Streptomyces griseochromogenes]|uniref:SMI1/KNR4 family protein n=1 Tax=Streptomyces griseochromogenes TaxID=68214 RepID=A0A1B1BA28_9ACTN|nr:hypothetical protein [Streptomyces griseochromogenes]ANP55647.1 hypothetical protein AVL59_44010 [Streptomyces griseochromogenes]MBP2052733.1 hypothetical protein [Streptomyces griseochromogenes]
MTAISPENPLTPQGAEALLAMLPALVEVEPGMSERELDLAEERWGFRFAPEHRTLLGAGLPTGRSWPDWRDGDPEDLAERLAWPVDGVLFDVEHNGLWLTDWDARPAGTQDALEVARTHLAGVPVMVPIHSHRYLLADPDRTGTPVLSMYQTDIIYYGTDLVDYFHHEFGRPVPTPEGHRYATIPFWSSFLE